MGHGGRLDNLPWEYLYSAGLGRFLVLSTDTPVVRYIDLTHRPATLMMTPPLRLLVVVASPRELPALDLEGEWARLQSALGGVERSGLLELRLLHEPTIQALQRTLWESDFNVLHFLGHGTFDDATRDGRLLFEKADGSAHPVSGEYLGTLLHDHHTMRLVTINACEGARTSAEDPFAGIAQSLVRQGIPAVVAMQFVITDRAAIQFASTFYSAVAAGTPVDESLARARKVIFGADNDIEWGIPVLYSRSADGRVFDVAIEDRPPTAEPTHELRPAAAAEPVPLPQRAAHRTPAPSLKSRLPLVIGAAIATLAVVVASFAAAGLWDTPPGSVTVPNVVGLAEDDAGAVLQDAGLAFRGEFLERGEAGDTPAGAVARTSPPAGTEVLRDSVVELLLAPPDDGIPPDERPPTDDS